MVIEIIIIIICKGEVKWGKSNCRLFRVRDVSRMDAGGNWKLWCFHHRGKNKLKAKIKKIKKENLWIRRFKSKSFVWKRLGDCRQPFTAVKLLSQNLCLFILHIYHLTGTIPTTITSLWDNFFQIPGCWCGSLHNLTHTCAQTHSHPVWAVIISLGALPYTRGGPSKNTQEKKIWEGQEPRALHSHPPV